MNIKWVGSVALALVVGLGGGYAIRSATAPTTPSLTLPNGRHFTPPSGFGPGGGFGGRGGFGATGKVAAVNGNTLEVQGASGQVAVKLSSTTAITRTVKAAASAITVGLCVTAVGPANSVGTVSATRVVITDPVNGTCSTGFRVGGAGGSGGAGG